jgi:cation diffusion facilitator family transporter
MSSNTLTKAAADRLKNTAAIASISVAVSLCLLKVFGALLTDSLAVLSSMIDSLSDIFGSLITLIAIRYAAKPASCEHRYGYGKAEALSALTQAAFIAGSGLFVMYDGFSRFITPRPIADTGLGLVVMIISIIATLILISFQRYVAKKTNSQAILADSAHYVVDILTNGSIILSLFVVRFFDFQWFDPLTAIFIALYLLYNAYQLARDAIALLLDRELPDEIRCRVEKTVTALPFVCGMHDLRTHDLGGAYMFEFHLELDGSLSLCQAHEYSDAVSAKLRKEFPDAQIVIHQDPSGIKEIRLDDKLVNNKRNKS